MGESEDTAEDVKPVQDTQDLPKKKKKIDKDDVKIKSLQNKNKNIKMQESPSDPLHIIPDVGGLNDTEVVLKGITVKIRSKLLFNVSMMEGGWFDQVCDIKTL